MRIARFAAAAVVCLVASGCFVESGDDREERPVAEDSAAATSGSIWVTAYYAAWQRGRMPEANPPSKNISRFAP